MNKPELDRLFKTTFSVGVCKESTTIKLYHTTYATRGASRGSAWL